MCTVGVTGKVVLNSEGRMDYLHIWGARIAFTLSDDGPYDAPAHGVTGFAFHIDSEPPPKEALRVTVSSATASADPPFWGGATAESSPIHVGRNELRWVDVGGPIWTEHPPRLDPSRLLSIAFSVPADPGGTKAFSFCISDVAALTN
jgi:hypothetical protein